MHFSDKQVSIIKALATMLEQPGSGRITTAALAREMNHSEAALYRHYANKAAIFEGLISLVGEQILEDLAHIEATEPKGRLRLRKQLYALLLFVERHPGAARVLTGGALVNEAPFLQTQVNELLAHIETALANSASLGIEQKELTGTATHLASAVLHLALGKWLRYVQSGCQAAPTLEASALFAALGL